MEKKVQIKIECDPRPIRHLAIQCPGCERWFMCDDIVTDSSNYPMYEEDISFFTDCRCPVCGKMFNLKNVEKDESVEFPEFYKNCTKKKVTWE